MYGAPVGAAGLRPLLQTVNSGRPKLVTSGIFTPMAARHSVVYLDDEDNSPPECAENPNFVNEARDYFSHTPSASNFHAEPSPFTAALNQAQALNCEYVNRKHQGRSEVGPQALAADYAPGREGRSPTPNFSSNTGSRRLRDSLYFDGMTSYTTGDFITSPYLNRTVDAYAQPLHHNSFPDTLGGRTNATDSQIVDYLDSRIDSTFDFVQNFGLSSDGEEEESPFSPVPNSA